VAARDASARTGLPAGFAVPGVPGVAESATAPEAEPA
jgi:hypothetical protein